MEPDQKKHVLVMWTGHLNRRACEGRRNQMYEPRAIIAEELQRLIDILAADGRRVIGPTVRDDVIIYDDIETVDDLPLGVTDTQGPGAYRLIEAPEAEYFSFVVGPHAWKKFLHAPQLQLWRAQREGDDIKISASDIVSERYAFIGVRACELAAISIQDRVLTGGEHIDAHYKARRENALIVAVNCSKAGGSCFCTSMGAGPAATSGFDLALTELKTAQDHIFIVEIGSSAGQALVDRLSSRAATAQEIDAALARIEQTAGSMGRSMPAGVNTPQLLADNLLHPRWQEVATRCLSCANCTMVCPTCFCTTVDDVSDLAGESYARERRWDSCFTMDFSYLHGGGVRNSVASRYRQWMTHKLSTWVEQFGSSGCVGCGRCITWCPVGIDITEEVRAIAGVETG